MQTAQVFIGIITNLALDVLLLGGGLCFEGGERLVLIATTEDAMQSAQALVNNA